MTTAALLEASLNTDSLQSRLANWARLPVRPDVEAMLQPADEWMISVATASLLKEMVERLAPMSILEFGAGRSSLILGDALATTRGGKLTSIEHQPQYARASWERLSQYPGIDAHMITARLGLELTRHGLLHSYTDVAQPLAKRAPYDFVFVDAPPGHLGRDTALLVAAPYLSPGALIVLDDARRQSEKTTVSRWERVLPITRVFESDGIGRGVTVLKLGRTAIPAFSLRNFLGTLHDRWLERRHGAPMP
jgi:predicted O-methyltransferase YrrM